MSVPCKLAMERSRKEAVLMTVLAENFMHCEKERDCDDDKGGK